MSAHSHHPKFSFSISTAHRTLFSKLSFLFGLLGTASLLAAFFIAQKDQTAFYFSFHVSWVYFVSIALGAVFFVLIQYATRAGWSVVVRRLAENVAQTLPLFLILFFVIILGSHHLFHHWLSTESMTDKILATKRWYLNQPFYYGRSFFYLLAFTAFAFYFAKKSEKQDKTGEHLITSRLQTRSAPFLIIAGFCMHFAAVDWIMALDPHWYSTIFGLYFFAGSYMAFIALLSILTRLASRVSSVQNAFGTEHYHDLGKLLFGHTCFWAYAAFVQFLLIWYANIPEETRWYGIRQNHGWYPFWIMLCVGHFIVPFLLLMARKAKRTRNWVVFVAVWMLVMHFVDIYWLIMPTHYEVGPSFQILDVLCLFGIGGLFLSLFCAFTSKKSLIPVRDPRLNESLTYENV